MEKEITSDMELKPSPPKRKWLFLIVATAITFLVLIYAAAVYAAQEYSMPFVTYQGKDVGLKTFPEVTKIVMQSDKELSKQNIIMIFDGKEQTKSIGDLGISVQSSKTVDSIFNYGKKRFFISIPKIEYFKKIATKKAIAPIDIKRSSETEKKIKEIFENSQKDAINPTISIADDRLVVNKEEPGYKIDINDFETQLENSLNSKIPVKLVLKKTSTRSNFTSADLEHFKPQIEELVAKSISLQSDYKKLLLKKEDIAGLIDLEMTILSQKITFSDKAIEDYLNSVSKYFNVKGRTKKVSTIDNAVIDEGTEGQKLDVKMSTQNIKEAMLNGSKVAKLEVTTSPIEEELVSPGYNPGKYPGKFVEVNLSQQMLYTFEGTQLLGSYRVSTGKWSMPTPEGEYAINNKVDRAYSQEYDLYMPYWMAFIGSQYGLHELPEWADGTKEGESHLGTPVSHGCVRLGRGAAQEVYQWVEIGTPVYIHR